MAELDVNGKENDGSKTQESKPFIPQMLSLPGEWEGEMHTHEQQEKDEGKEILPQMFNLPGEDVEMAEERGERERREKQQQEQQEQEEQRRQLELQKRLQEEDEGFFGGKADDDVKVVFNTNCNVYCAS